MTRLQDVLQAGLEKRQEDAKSRVRDVSIDTKIANLDRKLKQQQQGKVKMPSAVRRQRATEPRKQMLDSANAETDQLLKFKQKVGNNAALEGAVTEAAEFTFGFMPAASAPLSEHLLLWIYSNRTMENLDAVPPGTFTEFYACCEILFYNLQVLEDTGEVDWTEFVNEVGYEAPTTTDTGVRATMRGNLDLNEFTAVSEGFKDLKDLISKNFRAIQSVIDAVRAPNVETPEEVDDKRKKGDKIKRMLLTVLNIAKQIAPALVLFYFNYQATELSKNPLIVADLWWDSWVSTMLSIIPSKAPPRGLNPASEKHARDVTQEFSGWIGQLTGNALRGDTTVPRFVYDLFSQNRSAQQAQIRTNFNRVRAKLGILKDGSVSVFGASLKLRHAAYFLSGFMMIINWITSCNRKRFERFLVANGEYLRVHTFTIFRKYIDMRQVMHNDRKEPIAVPQQLRLKTPVLMDAWYKAVVNADELIKARKDGELGEGIADVTTAAAQFIRVLNFVPVASDVIAVATHARDIYVYKKWRDEAKIVVDALNKVLEDVNKLKVEIETSSNGVPYMQTSSRTGKYEWKLDKDWDAKPNVLKARSKMLSGQIEVDGSEDFVINQDYMLDMSSVVQKRV